RQQHVAGHSADAVQIEGGCHFVARIRAAPHAAPNPLSMLVTSTPWAQLASMALSAVWPPWAAPYPVDVGTAMTGQATSPPTTEASAASIPATTINACSLRRS